MIGGLATLFPLACYALHLKVYVGGIGVLEVSGLRIYRSPVSPASQ